MQAKKIFQFLMVGTLSLFLTACETAEVIYTKLGERDINEMVAVLSTAGIAADRVNKTEEKLGITYDLQINDKTHFSQAIKILTAQGLPRKTFKTFGEVFKGDGMVSTPLEQKARYLYALSEGLSQTLNDIDGVKNARVHLVLSEIDPISRARMPASASVMIQHEARMDTTTLIPKVKKLLSAGVDGLAYENVNVVLFQDGAGAPRGQTPQELALAAGTEAGLKSEVAPVAYSALKNKEKTSSEVNPEKALSSAKQYYDQYNQEAVSQTGSTIFILMGLLLVIFILIFVVLFLKRRDYKPTGQDLAYYE